MKSIGEYFKSNYPTYEDGTPFFGYNVPASQTFTSYAPSSDMEAYLINSTGLDGWQKRQLLQHKKGTEIIRDIANKKLNKSLKYLSYPGYTHIEPCHNDGDCDKGKVCSAFNYNVFGPQQGPVCTEMEYENKGKKFWSGVNLDLDSGMKMWTDTPFGMDLGDGINIMPEHDSGVKAKPSPTPRPKDAPKMSPKLNVQKSEHLLSNVNETINHTKKTMNPLPMYVSKFK